jgi:hypothetical protein
MLDSLLICWYIRRVYYKKTTPVIKPPSRGLYNLRGYAIELKVQGILKHLLPIFITGEFTIPLSRWYVNRF